MYFARFMSLTAWSLYIVTVLDLLDIGIDLAGILGDRGRMASAKGEA